MAQRIASGCLVFHEGNCLLLRRSALEDTMQGLWEMPAGKIESETDGSPQENAIRETFEEAGILLEVVSPLGEHLTDEKRFYGFIGVSDTDDVVLSYEHDAYEWISTPDILAEVASGKRRVGHHTIYFLQDILDSAEGFMFEAEDSKKPARVEIKKSTNEKSKLMAIFYDKNDKKIKTTHFGWRGMSDYTKHKDKERLKSYDARHGAKKSGENWKKPMTAGALSKWILWNKPTLKSSFDDYKRRFKLKGDLKVTKSAESNDDAKLREYETTYGKKQSKIRMRLKKKILKEKSMGTKANQWSARKSQKLKQKYEEACEKAGLNPYKGSKTEKQDDLEDWSDQDWTTSSGKKSSKTGEPYFPAKAVAALKRKRLYAKAKRQKAMATKEGKQNARYSDDIRDVVAKYRAERFESHRGSHICPNCGGDMRRGRCTHHGFQPVLTYGSEMFDAYRPHLRCSSCGGDVRKGRCTHQGFRPLSKYDAESFAAQDIVLYFGTSTRFMDDITSLGLEDPMLSLNVWEADDQAFREVDMYGGEAIVFQVSAFNDLLAQIDWDGDLFEYYGEVPPAAIYLMSWDEQHQMWR